MQLEHVYEIFYGHVLGDPRLSGYSANTPSFIYFNIKRPRVNFSKKISTEIQII